MIPALCNAITWFGVMCGVGLKGIHWKWCLNIFLSSTILGSWDYIYFTLYRNTTWDSVYGNTWHAAYYLLFTKELREKT